jgi:hypothetical protein
MHCPRDNQYRATIVTEHPQQTEPPRYWAQSAPSARWQRDDSGLRRFLGGSPLAVLVKLVLISLIVGALLMWLNIRPVDVFRELSDLFDRLWALGFRSIRDFGNYILAGAAIVVPVWLVLRLLSFRGR